MKSIIFVKWSERLPGKHHLQICGHRMIDIVCRVLKESGLLEEILIFSKDETMSSKMCNVVYDHTQGVLLDSIIDAIKTYRNFLAVGGDMPFIDSNLIGRLLDEYAGKPVAYVSEDGQIEPLLAIYNSTILKDITEYSNRSKALQPFISSRFKLISAGDDSNKLRSVNTMDDLEVARRIFGCY